MRRKGGRLRTNDDDLNRMPDPLQPRCHIKARCASAAVSEPAPQPTSRCAPPQAAAELVDPREREVATLGEDRSPGARLNVDVSPECGPGFEVVARAFGARPVAQTGA
jgi:hypothetical protein